VGDPNGKDFGEVLPGSDEPNWMWTRDLSTYKQRLLVISTPFVRGRHFAESPAEFLPLVDQLQELHAAGLVHGDIRGFNTAFTEDGRSSFFDWDLGGKAEQVTYPKGYRHQLDDGERFDRSGQAVRKLDDWYALTRLALARHHITSPPTAEGGLSYAKDVLLRFPYGETRDDVQKHVVKLKKFLRDAEAKSWTVELAPNFYNKLINLNDAGKATGSPPKRIKQGGKQVEINESARS
jgi:hypothetical protein